MFCEKGENINIGKSMETARRGKAVKSVLCKGKIIKGIMATSCTVITGMVAVRVVSIAERGTGKSYVLAAAIFAALIYCFAMYVKEEFILPSQASKKRKDTQMLSKQVHGISNEEMVKLLIIENYCPEIQRVYLEEEGSIRLVGKHSVHVVHLGEEGAVITSYKKDCKADIEANAIMRFLVEVSH